MKFIEIKGFSKDFLLGKYPVKNQQWERFMGQNNSNASQRNHPVVNVNWYDAITFCNLMSEKAGLSPYYKIQDFEVEILGGNGYRLPSKLEWGYAARGGSKSQEYKYSGSNDLDEVAWFGNNSKDRTHAVGKKKSNELGLYDMSGNIWEWCEDSITSNNKAVIKGSTYWEYELDSKLDNIKFSYKKDIDPALGFRIACFL